MLHGGGGGVVQDGDAEVPGDSAAARPGRLRRVQHHRAVRARGRDDAARGEETLQCHRGNHHGNQRVGERLEPRRVPPSREIRRAPAEAGTRRRRAQGGERSRGGRRGLPPRRRRRRGARREPSFSVAGVARDAASPAGASNPAGEKPKDAAGREPLGGGASEDGGEGPAAGTAAEKLPEGGGGEGFSFSAAEKGSVAAFSTPLRGATTPTRGARDRKDRSDGLGPVATHPGPTPRRFPGGSSATRGTGKLPATRRRATRFASFSPR